MTNKNGFSRAEKPSSSFGEGTTLWVYQTQTNKMPSCRKSSVPRQPAPAGKAEPLSGRKNAALPAAKPSQMYGTIFGCCYLAGELLGCLTCHTFEGELQDFARYFYQTSLSLYQNGAPLQLFGAKFLSCFCMFSFIALMGFCAFGAPVLLGTAFLKGFSSGVFFLQLFSDPSQKGFIASLLLFWLPELLTCLLMICLLTSAFGGAAALFKTSLGVRAHNLPGLQRWLLRRYLATCLGAVLPSLTAVFLGRLFSFLLV